MSEEWDGVERRKTPADVVELRGELQSIQGVMRDVVSSMGNLMPRDEIDQAIRVERRDRYRVTMVFAAAIAILLTFVIVSVAQLGQLRGIARSNNRVLAEIECVVGVVAREPREQQPAAFERCLRLSTVTPKDLDRQRE